MEWLETINQTTEYIEEHMGENINFEEFSKQINVSYFYLLKMFKTITGVGLKEYVKNRRLSVSCYDLLNTEDNILKIALKYGYNSNEAFTRAFKKFHDVTPKEVRAKKMMLRHYPMIHFNVSKVKLEEVNFTILRDYEITLYGKKIRYKEDYSMSQTKLLEHFTKDTEDLFSEHVMYTAKSNFDISGYPVYDIVHGVKSDTFDDVEKYTFSADKVIKYQAKGNHPFILRSLKQKILEEWYHNSLEFNGVLELECVYESDDGIHIEYIVSIN